MVHVSHAYKILDMVRERISLISVTACENIAADPPLTHLPRQSVGVYGVKQPQKQQQP